LKLSKPKFALLIKGVSVILHLIGSTGGWLNGVYRLDASTVVDDGTADSLFGDAGLD
jgi:hypothetical protein